MEGENKLDQEFQDKLMGILLQLTWDVAGMVVRPFAEEGDGVGAWRALIMRYDNDSGELTQSKRVNTARKRAIMKNNVGRKAKERRPAELKNAGNATKRGITQSLCLREHWMN